MTPVTLPVIIDDLRASLGDESLPLAWVMPGGSDVYEYAVHNREDVTFRTTDAGRIPWFRRVTIPLEPCSALSWLAHQSAYPKVYWSSRDGRFESAGLGSAFRAVANADSCVIREDILRFVSDVVQLSEEGIRLFGGHAFAEVMSTSGPWDTFGDVQFILPRIELRREGDTTTLSCYLDACAEAHGRRVLPCWE